MNQPMHEHFKPLHTFFFMFFLPQPASASKLHLDYIFRHGPLPHILSSLAGRKKKSIAQIAALTSLQQKRNATNVGCQGCYLLAAVPKCLPATFFVLLRIFILFCCFSANCCCCFHFSSIALACKLSLHSLVLFCAALLGASKNDDAVSNALRHCRHHHRQQQSTAQYLSHTLAIKQFVFTN